MSSPARCSLWGLLGLGSLLAFVGCSVTSQSDPDIQILIQGEECRACVSDRCQDTTDACNADRECVSIANCTARDVDPAASQVCLSDRRADSTSRYIGWRSCYASACLTPCNLGSDFSCVGSFDWPTAKNPVGVAFRLLDLASGSPVAGTEVRACDPETDCSAPRATVVTDADGQGDLSFSMPELGAAGPTPFRGYIKASGGGVFGGRVYLGIRIARHFALGPIALPNEHLLDPLGSIAVEPGTGLVVAFTSDCSGAGAPGVVIKLRDLAARE